MRVFLVLCMLLLAFAQAQIRVAAVGNSITYGYGLSDAWTQSYPAQLQTLLGAAYSVTNFGVSGTTMLKNGDNPYWNQTTMLNNARNLLPNMVVIELGTNDSKPYNWYVHQAAFSTDYASMIDTFRVLSSAPEVWICLAPYSNNVSWKITDTSITKRINPAILAVGLQKGTHVIDLHSIITDLSLLQTDSVHPTAAGAATIAAFVKSFFLRDTLTVQKSGATLNAPVGFGYQWYLNDAPISSANSQSLSITNLGKYKVSVKVDANSESRIVSKTLSVTSLMDSSGTPPSSAALSSAALSSAVQVPSSSNASSNSTQSSSSISNSSSAVAAIRGDLSSPLLVSMHGPVLNGSVLQVELSQASAIRADIYDIQGHLLQSLVWQGTAGVNTQKIAITTGLRIAKVSWESQVQTTLSLGR